MGHMVTDIRMLTDGICLQEQEKENSPDDRRGGGHGSQRYGVSFVFSFVFAYIESNPRL